MKRKGGVGGRRGFGNCLQGAAFDGYKTEARSQFERNDDSVMDNCDIGFRCWYIIL